MKTTHLICLWGAFTVLLCSQPTKAQTILGNTSVCLGDNPQGYGISDDYTTCNYVTWSVSGGASSVISYNNGTPPSANVTWSTVGTWVLYANSSSMPGCSDPPINLSLTVTVIDQPGLPSLSTNSPNSELCSGESWTLTCSLSGYPSNYGYDWYTTGGLLINNLSSSSGSPVHTDANAATLTIGSGYGLCYIYVRLNNGACPSPYAHLSTQVGQYNSSQISIAGPSSGCSNQVLDFNCTPSGSPVTGYQWNTPNGWNTFGQGTPDFSVTLPSNFNGGAITLQLQNRCGWTGSPAVKFISSGSCFSPMRITASPNPAANTLAVAALPDNGLTDETTVVETNASVILVNSLSAIVKRGRMENSKLLFDVSDLPNGVYYLKIIENNQVTQTRILIRH